MITINELKPIFGKQLKPYKYGYIYKAHITLLFTGGAISRSPSVVVDTFIGLLRQSYTYFYVCCEEPDFDSVNRAGLSEAIEQVGEDVYCVSPALSSKLLNLTFCIGCHTWYFWGTSDNSAEKTFASFLEPSEEELIQLIDQDIIQCAVCMYGDGIEMRILPSENS